MAKVMVFGAFDGLHAGHRALLREAKTFGDYLVVVVAQNAIISRLKGHNPKYDIGERLAYLQAENGVNEVVAGDARLSTSEVVKKHKPDVVVFGYDQVLMKEDFEGRLDKLGVKPIIKVASSFEPSKYHSSIINK